MLLRPLVDAVRRKSVSLMTFNVLAPCYFRHGGRVESADRAAFLSRAQALIHAVQREQCDLICLQEYWFNHEYQLTFRQAFRSSHYLHTFKRPGDKQDGLAIFVARHKFEIHNVVQLDFGHAGDRVAMMMHLATKWNRFDVPLPQRSFLLVNSHLTFPHGELYKKMRLDQIKLVLESVRDYVEQENLHHVPVLICGDFNDFNDPVHQLIMEQGYDSAFAYVHGREARITHCNHNNREVGVDFIFSSNTPDLKTNQLKATAEQRIENSQQEDQGMVLKPVACHLVPKRLPDATRLKRPRFGHDWTQVSPPDDEQDDHASHVNYWRMVSDHRPIVAKFEVIPAAPQPVE